MCNSKPYLLLLLFPRLWLDLRLMLRIDFLGQSRKERRKWGKRKTWKKILKFPKKITFNLLILKNSKLSIFLSFESCAFSTLLFRNYELKLKNQQFFSPLCMYICLSNIYRLIIKLRMYCAIHTLAKLHFMSFTKNAVKNWNQETKAKVRDTLISINWTS